MNNTVIRIERELTRKERYQGKKSSGEAKSLPIHSAVVNFGDENNYAFALRSSACFGAKKVHLIGNYSGKNAVLKAVSCATGGIIDTIQHSSPSEFVRHCRDNNIKIISLELPNESFGIKVTSLRNYSFDFSDGQEFVVCSGGESIGFPIEILMNSDVVYIDMNGAGYCLNNSQALNIGLYEASSQYMEYLKNEK